MNSALLDSFVCPICLDYSVDPVTSSCCEAIYCKECVKNIKRCSICRTENCEFKESLFAKRLINTIEAVCDCGYKCTRGDLNEHQKKCEITLISCPISECQMKIKRIECFDHIRKEHSAEMIQNMESVLQVFQNSSSQKSNATSAPAAASSD